jgi:Protein of unknown function (DUF3060)
MKREDDPEARIRELERPLSETARASELGSAQTPDGYPYPPGPPALRPPLPGSYGGPFPGSSTRSPSRTRFWWLLAPFVVIGVVSLISYNADRHSRGGLVTLSPMPSISSSAAAAPSPSEAQPPAPAPSTSPSPVATAPAGGNLSVAGIKESHTIACNDSIVSVSGISNTVVITGHCKGLELSGVQNKVTVDAVDTIEVSGFNNQITYHTGSPSIDKSGDGNIVQQG